MDPKPPQGGQMYGTLPLVVSGTCSDLKIDRTVGPDGPRGPSQHHMRGSNTYLLNSLVYFNT